MEKETYSAGGKSKSNQTFEKKNSESKWEWFILIPTIITYFVVEYFYDFEKIAVAIVLIPFWIISMRTMFKNQKTLSSAGFLQKHIKIDFYIGLVINFLFGLMLLSLFV